MKFYLKAILWSLCLHGILLLALFFKPSLQAKHYVLKKTPPNNEVIQSVSIDEVKVDRELQRILTAREERKRAQKAHQKRLKEHASALRKERIAEQKRLKVLKAQSEALKEAQIKQAKAQAEALVKEQKRLAHLKEKRRLAKEQMLKEKKAYEELQAKRLKEEKEKVARIQQAKLAAEEKKRREAEKIAQLKETLHQEALKEAKAQAMAGVVNRYKALIINAISQHWIVPPEANKTLSCRFEIHLADNGVVKSVRLLRSSGDPVLDRSARTAIYKASPLPVPKTPDAFALFKVVSLTVKPEGFLS